MVDKLPLALKTALDASGTGKAAADDVIGVDIVPAMTTHKSKGLEFNTMIFLGLEDSLWWNFANQPEEEKRGFFVAFSRVAEHIFFTFSDVRDERWGRRPQNKVQDWRPLFHLTASGGTDDRLPGLKK